MSSVYSPPGNQDENDGNEDIEIGYENLIKNSSADKSIQQSTLARLFQNVPNPCSVNTEIQFEIPENTISAKLFIHDMQGAELKSYDITTKGAGSIIIQGSELPAGMYLYTLVVDNKIIDTKRMILIK